MAWRLINHRYLSVVSSNERCNMDFYHQNPLDLFTFVIEGLHTSQFPSMVKGKVFSLQAQRVGRGIALPFHDHGTRRGWVVSSTPRPILPSGKPRYPFYRRMGGPQGRSGRAENLTPPGFDPRTVQPVVSRYTDWATRFTSEYGSKINFKMADPVSATKF